jgi:hypothetical protein
MEGAVRIWNAAVALWFYVVAIAAFGLSGNSIVL